MNNIEKKNLEIALLLCVPESFKAKGLKDKTRHKNLVMTIMQELDKELDRTPKVPAHRVGPLADTIFNFAEKLGWNKSKHPHTFLAFSLEIMERSKYQYSQRLWNAMTDLVAHIENNTPTYPACCVAGIAAADKWEASIDEWESIVDEASKKQFQTFLEAI